MAVLMGGAWYQDTNIFTDYVISSANEAAIQARDAAVAANAAANTASTNAVNAYNAASAASTNALNAYNSVNNAYGNTITAVRDAGGTVLSEARQSKTNALNAYNEARTANTKLDAIQNSITNIQNNMGADVTPPVVFLGTLSGARATSGNSILTIVDVSDNQSNIFTYSLDGINFLPLPPDHVISVPVNNPGVNHIIVWVKDESGNISTKSITIRKLN
ncbi:MAG: hypothetical protein K6T65_16455 [Peptococcaceae bacterium]|nr:hypothetical protein [Peptococcaceae bacterium]